MALVGLLILLAACDRAPPAKIVLIGGVKSEGPARHDYPNGIRILKNILESSPDADRRLVVDAYPDGWPQGPNALDGASTLVWYFDGLEKHPLLGAAHKAPFEAAMKRGAGLVALHQTSTVLPGNDLGLPRWLGGARYGMFDRTTEWAELAAAMPVHPVSRGAGVFAYRDEFYPTLRFRNGAVPVLKTPPQGNIPPRRLITTRTRERIVDTLTRGAMRAQAQGLSTEQIDSVARYPK